MSEKRRKRQKRAAHRERVQAPGEVSISKEVDYIIRRAQQGEGRVVGLGSLVLFSTDTGDAWLLDPADRQALCLARAGVRQPCHILETAERFTIEFDRAYVIDGDLFVTCERSSGRITTVVGYPVRVIEATIERHRQRG